MWGRSYFIPRFSCSGQKFDLNVDSMIVNPVLVELILSYGITSKWRWVTAYPNLPRVISRKYPKFFLLYTVIIMVVVVHIVVHSIVTES